MLRAVCDTEALLQRPLRAARAGGTQRVPPPGEERHADPGALLFLSALPGREAPRRQQRCLLQAECGRGYAGRGCGVVARKGERKPRAKVMVSITRGFPGEERGAAGRDHEDPTCSG